MTRYLTTILLVGVTFDTGSRCCGQEPKLRATLKGHIHFVHSVVFSPDGRMLASGSFDSTIKLWEVRTGQERAVLGGHTNGVLSVAFSPDGKSFLTGGSDNAVRRWDAASGQPIGPPLQHAGTVLGVHVHHGEVEVGQPDVPGVRDGSVAGLSHDLHGRTAHRHSRPGAPRAAP